MIKIHNLEKSFGNNHVLNGVNIEITKEMRRVYMKLKMKKELGITLIALVVTIIVILILARS